MEKLVYLLRADADRPGAEIRTALIDEAAPRLRHGGASELTFDVHDEHTTAGQQLCRREPPIRAMASFWHEDANEATECQKVLAGCCDALDGFLVVESRPLVHERPRGERTPGVNQVTCIARRPDLDYEEFLRIWQFDHRKVAIETQSTTGYVRNVIVRKLTPGAPDWAAIVEETFPIEALTDPHVFYAADSDELLKQNTGRMIESCKRFLDFGPMEVTHMSEYYLG